MGAPTVKQFYIELKKDENFLVLFAHYLACSDVTHFVRNDVAPVGRNDVMFAHCAVGTTSLPKATSLGEADITCT